MAFVAVALLRRRRLQVVVDINGVEVEGRQQLSVNVSGLRVSLGRLEGRLTKPNANPHRALRILSFSQTGYCVSFERDICRLQGSMPVLVCDFSGSTPETRHG